MYKSLLIFSLLALRLTLPAAAQLPKLSVGGPSPTPTIAISEASISEAQAGLATEVSELQRARATSLGPVVEVIEDQIAATERLDLLYARQLATLRETQHLTDVLAQTKQALAGLRGGSAPEIGPFSLLQLDAKQDEVETLTRAKTTSGTGLAAAQSALLQSRQLYEAAEKKRREARDSVTPATSAEENAVAMQKATLAELRSRVANEIVVMRELEVRRDRALDELQAAKLELEQERLERMKPQVHFTAEEYANLGTQLDARHAALAARLEAASKELDGAEKEWVKDRQKLDLSTATDAVLGERVAARQRAYAAIQAETEMLRAARQRIDDERRVWERRFALANGDTKPADEVGWAEELSVSIDQFEREEELQVARLADLRFEALNLSDRISEIDNSDPSKRWLNAQRDSLSKLNELHTEQLAEVSRHIRILHRLGAELDVRADTRSIAERLETVWVFVRSAWGYELTSIDDESITVGKLILVILLLTLGLRAARVFSRLVGQRLLPRLGVPSNAAAAFESVAYYLAIVAVVLFALRAVNIPLTVFTIVGGAVAIGVGFGSQNIVNNFISGLILLAERPISVGDMVQVEGTLGTIERIGPRSTRVRTFENTHVLIPNSYFLENRFVNWTLSDDVYRSKVNVGVAYGSHPRQVAKLLLSAAKGVPHIQEWPEPWVRFNEFGDNSLMFSLCYFVKPLSEVWAVDTEVRYRIEEVLRANQVEIAFPQRDIHFVGKEPLRIHMVPEGTRPPTEADS